MKKVLMVIANSWFQDTEFTAPYEYLKKNGIQITISAEIKGECYGVFGKKVNADIALALVDAKDYDMVLFVGGGGAYSQYFKDENYLKLARDAKKIWAICIAPMIISDAGVLLGKRFTCWDQNNVQINYISQNGGVYSDENVVVHGNIVTANGPSSAEPFARKVLDLLDQND